MCVLLVGYSRYFNFLASYDVFLIIIFYKLITRLKIKISEKTDQQNTDNVIPLKLDYRSIYTNIKANFTTFESLNTNLLLYVCQTKTTHAGVMSS
jgi:hypothetical protein